MRIGWLTATAVLCGAALIGGCSRRDGDQQHYRDNSAARDAGRGAYHASREAGKLAGEAARELKRDAHEFRQGWKDASRESHDKRK